MSWRTVLGARETWAYCGGKFLIDPIWWTYLFWLPDFFARAYHLDLKSFGPPRGAERQLFAAVPYIQPGTRAPWPRCARSTRAAPAARRPDRGQSCP